MKRISLPITVQLLVEDDAAHLDRSMAIDSALRAGMPEVESVMFMAGVTVTDVRQGTCKVGPHPFMVDRWFPANKPVPDICREHAYVAAIEDAKDEHAPFFNEVERLTGLKGYIWQSGGMTMTIVVPLPGKEIDEFPCYMGLKEGETDDGTWLGSLSFYPVDPNELDTPEPVDLLPDDWTITPEEWAARLTCHYGTIKEG